MLHFRHIHQDGYINFSFNPLFHFLRDKWIILFGVWLLLGLPMGPGETLHINN